MAVRDTPSASNELEERVGHPGMKWSRLQDQVRSQRVSKFETVLDDWLDLLWTLDSYRREEIVPRDMGDAKVKPAARLAAIYRSKGNWFAELIAGLLSNATGQTLAPRARVRGFSQLHQIDVAWPDRSAKLIADPRVCVETKLTGAPGYGDYGPRGAMDDWSNRRKELKFAATDLKLARKGLGTEIDHWDEWRLEQDPLCYFMWGARLKPKDSVDKMAREVQALTKTYLDGAGIVAWRENVSGTGYEVVPVGRVDPSDHVSEIDDVLRRIAVRIKKQSRGGAPPPEIEPAPAPVAIESLDQD